MKPYEEIKKESENLKLKVWSAIMDFEEITGLRIATLELKTECIDDRCMERFLRSVEISYALKD